MPLKKNILANYLGQGWAALMGLAFIPVYIHYLGVEAYGLIGIFALLQVWLSLLDMGMSPVLSREMARFIGGAHNTQSIRNLLRSIEIIGFGVAALVALGIWAASGWLATDWLRVGQLSVDAVARAFALMGIVTALRFIENIYKSSLVGLQRQVVLNVVTSAMATLRGLGAVGILMWVSPTIEAFFLWQGIVSVISVGLFALFVYQSLHAAPMAGRFSPAALQGVWRFAAGTITLTLLGFLLSQTDKLILTKLLSLEEFGYYSLAFTVASSVRLLAQPVDQGVYPRLTALFQQKNEAVLAKTYHKANQLSVVLMGGFGVFLAIFGEPVLLLWTQNQELTDSTYQIMSILIIGMVLNGLMNGPYTLQMAAGWTGLLVRVNSVMVVVFIPVIYLLTQRYGAIGAATAWAILNLAYIMLLARLMHKKLLRNAMWEWYTKDLLLPLTAAITTGIVLKATMPSEHNALLLMLYLMIAMLSIVLASALAASHVRREIQIGIRRIVGQS